jgi:FKBP-type peptidyl-prolyl cis-trans isomerase
MNKAFKDYFIILGLLVFSALVYFLFPEHAIQTHDQTKTREDITTNPPPAMPNQEAQLNIKVIAEGTGRAAQNGERISVAYTGKLTDGTIFDSSIPRGEPFVLTLGKGEVIAGWEIGLLGMKVGEKRQLTIPSELAYGEAGFPGVIPGGATLIFDVELLAIQ